MTEQKVWAVTESDYDYSKTLAVFECEADAEALVERLEASNHHSGWVGVDELTYYPTGDQSLRPVTYWTHEVTVLEDGAIQEGAVDDQRDFIEYNKYGRIDQLSTEKPPTRNKVRWAYYMPGACVVSGVGAIKELARSDAMSVAEQVAAQILAGTDPVKAQYSPEDLARMAEEAEQAAEASYQRKKLADEAALARDAEAEQKWQEFLAPLEAALFSGMDNQVGDWVPFGDATITAPGGFSGMITHVKVRDSSGQVVRLCVERHEVQPGDPVVIPAWKRP